MKVFINEEYRITSDSRQFILQVFDGIDRRNGQTKWRGLSYHPSLEGLISALVWRDLRAGGGNPDESLRDALNRVQVLVGELRLALAPLLKIELAPGSVWQAEQREVTS